jgi:hypothetical protein
VTADLRGALRCLAEALPPGAIVPVPRDVLLELVTNGTGASPVASPSPAGGGWRERLWTCPADTRLGVREVAEALGRPRSWVYRAAAVKRGLRRLPAVRFGGELVFEAGVVRDWVTREESGAVSRPAQERERPRVRGRYAKRQDAEPKAEPLAKHDRGG